jgi:drug/metabolite transporter (DMT)-like permease
MNPLAVPLALHLGSLTPLQSLGIPVSLVGSVFLALGAEFQHAGVRTRQDDARPGRLGGVLDLLRTPVWLLGTALLGLSIVFQLVSLALAPLTVVQPLGAAALVITAVLNARATHARLDRAALRAIGLCVVGIGLFVTVAAGTTSSRPVRSPQLVAVLVILAVVLTIAGGVVLAFRSRLRTIGFVFGAGILFGFVATLAKVVIDRVHTLIASGEGFTSADWLTAACLLGMAAAGGLGMYLVQNAYAMGPPDLVVAGLTVVDPMVGVTIGIVVLGEATSAPLWAIPVFALAGAAAVVGVLQLARHPAQVALRAPRAARQP